MNRATGPTRPTGRRPVVLAVQALAVLACSRWAGLETGAAPALAIALPTMAVAAGLEAVLLPPGPLAEVVLQLPVPSRHPFDALATAIHSMAGSCLTLKLVEKRPDSVALGLREVAREMLE